MKQLVVLLLCLCMGGYPGHAQAPAAASSSALPGSQVFVRIVMGYRGWDADFDTDGHRIGGLSEAELKTKFTKVQSAASVVNFMTQNGYRVAGFSSTQDGTNRGNGGSFNGYAMLFELRP